MKKSGFSLGEYVIILGIVSAALIGMNTYLKRGIQGKLKEMTDFFIAAEQDAETNPQVISTVTTDTTSDTAEQRLASVGGSSESNFWARVNTATSAHSEDFSSASDSTPFIPADEEMIVIPPERPPGEEEFIEQEEKKAKIERLKAEKERLEKEAEMLEQTAPDIEEQGKKLVEEADRMDCHGEDSCHRARSKMRRQGRKLIRQAEEMRQKARDLRERAARKQAEIDELEAQLNDE